MSTSDSRAQSAVLNLEEFIKQVVALAVEEAMQKMGPRDEPYTPENLPPGKTRRWFTRQARYIPGARQLGRTWVVDRANFDRWSQEETTRKREAKLAAQQEEYDEKAAIERDLRKMGYVSRGSVR